MENNNQDKWWGPLVSLMLLALIVFGAYALKNGKTLEGVSIIIGVLITKVGTLIDFKYGSSKGSKDKTDLLAVKEAPLPAAPVPAVAPVIDEAAITAMVMKIIKSVVVTEAPPVATAPAAGTDTNEKI